MGADTADVLEGWLGLSKVEIVQLVASEVVGLE
jgi:hypothetical protein